MGLHGNYKRGRDNYLGDPSKFHKLYDLKGGSKMVNVTVNATETERHDLKSAEGGFVVLRRMSYNEYLRRRDIASDLSFKGEGKKSEAIMNLTNERVARYEFERCIVDHNLTEPDENGAEGKPLDFRTSRAFTILDPRVGEEISKIIEEMNKFEDGEDLGN